MADEEIVACVKRLVIQGKKVGDICRESGISYRTIQKVLRDQSPLSLVVRLRLEDYCKRSGHLLKSSI